MPRTPEEKSLADNHFCLGVYRTVSMVVLAEEKGMLPLMVHKMLEAYIKQLDEWIVEGMPGEPPSGYGLVGEYMAIQREGEEKNKG